MKPQPRSWALALGLLALPGCAVLAQAPSVTIHIRRNSDGLGHHWINYATAKADQVQGDWCAMDVDAQEILVPVAADGYLFIDTWFGSQTFRMVDLQPGHLDILTVSMVDGVPLGCQWSSDWKPKPKPPYVPPGNLPRRHP